MMRPQSDIKNKYKDRKGRSQHSMYGMSKDIKGMVFTQLFKIAGYV